jgi:hypothetical protein
MAVKEDVNIKVSADMAEALQAWKDIENGPKALEEALRRIGELEQNTSTKWASALDGVIAKWTSVSFLIQQATKAITAFLNEQAKLRAESVGSTAAIDAGLTSYRVAQGNLSGDAAQIAAGRIALIAQQSKASLPGAFDAATQLAKFGASREQAEGSALAQMLQVQDVAQAGGRVDPQSLSRAVLSILKRSGQPITGQSIRGLGSTALGLSQAGTGFGLGQLEEFQKVASVAGASGVGLPDTLAVFAAIREKEESKRALSQFRGLFDQDVRPGEAQQIQALLQRGRGMLAAGGGEEGFAGAAAIVSGSMAAGETQAESIYGASGYRPGILSQEEIRKRFISARRAEFGVSPLEESLQGYYFDVLRYFGGPENAIQKITSSPFSPAPANPLQARIRERALGRQEFYHHLILPDGRDVPVQTEGEALNQDVSNDATQSANFRSP